MIDAMILMAFSLMLFMLSCLVVARDAFKELLGSRGDLTREEDSSLFLAETEAFRVTLGLSRGRVLDGEAVGGVNDTTGEVSRVTSWKVSTLSASPWLWLCLADDLGERTTGFVVRLFELPRDIDFFTV